MHLEWFILGSTSHRQSGRRREGERGRGRERDGESAGVFC